MAYACNVLLDNESCIMDLKSSTDDIFLYNTIICIKYNLS